jgi:hypothetical protein
MSAQAQPIVSDAEFEPPPLGETGWTREQLLDALKNDTELPAEVAGLATIYASEIERDVVATFERAHAEEFDPASERLLFRGIHILGAARLTAAYRPLIALLRRPPDEVEYLLGDAVTATLPKILAGVFDGDAEPLFALITDGDLDQFVRAAALRAFAFLTFDGKIDHAIAEAFLTRFDQQNNAPKGDVTWLEWMTAVALLGLEHLSARVHAAFDDGRIPFEFADEDDYRELLAEALARPADPARFEAEQLGYISDIAETLALFPEQDLEELAPEDLEGFEERDLEWTSAERDLGWTSAERDREWTPAVPARNPYRNVGRNDACPCGSGKKFKKCCLPAAALTAAPR